MQDADIAEKKAVVEKMIKNILKMSIVAGKQEKEAQEKKAFLDAQNEEIAEKKAGADRDLEAALPIIVAA